jgi:sulfite reductase (NADPH) flavoprotein alpha-component
LNYSVLAWVIASTALLRLCPSPAFLAGQPGRQPLFAPVEVDSGDTAALQHWQQQLGN